MQKRIQYLDLAKAIAIILVVVGHFIQTFYGDSSEHNLLFVVIYSFHMPLFFIISGMIFKEIEILNQFWKWILKKIKQLIIPSYLFIAIFILFIAIFKTFNISFLTSSDTVTIQKIVRTALQFRVEALVPNMWFLPALFFTEVLVCLLHLVLKNDIVRALIIAVFSILGAAYICIIGKPLPFSIDNALLLSIFFEIGFLIKKYIKDYRRMKNSIIALVFGIIWIISTFVNYFCFGHKSIGLAYVNLSNPVLFYLEALAGSLMLIFICRSIKELKDDNRLIRYGQNTLYTYGLNQIFLSLAFIALQKWIGENIFVDITVCLIIVIFILEVSSTISIVMKKRKKAFKLLTKEIT